jgi:hypothetical protein
VGAFADYYAKVIVRQRVDATILIGYGEGVRVTPVVLALRDRLAARRLPVLEVLRVADGRYWSYVCGDPGCCPPEGVSFDPATSPAVTAAVVDGCVALPSRAALEKRLAPLGGLGRVAMTQATERADQRLVDLVEASEDKKRGAVLKAAGVSAVDCAVARQRAGACLDDDALAWLTVVLVYVPVRDYAWEAIGGDLGVHIGLWTDVLRRADPELVAAPATLLAFAAWRAGEGAVASIAVTRALAADPDYQMALLLDQALAGGLSPAEWDAARRRPAPVRSGRRRRGSSQPTRSGRA